MEAYVFKQAAPNTLRREMNDLNFARFGAKLGERIAELEARIDGRITALEACIDARINALELKLERRLADVEVRLTRRVFMASAATLLAQIAALVTLLKLFGTT